MSDRGPDGPPPSADPPPPPPPPYAPPATSPRRMRWALVAGGAVVLVAVLAAIVVVNRRDDTSPVSSPTTATTPTTTLPSTTVARSTTTATPQPTTTSTTASTTTSTSRPASTTTATTALPVLQYRTIRDETGFLTIDVPSTWTDVDGSPVDDGPSLVASPNRQAWQAGWRTPGLRFFATTLFDVPDQPGILDAWVPEGCTVKEWRHDYSPRGYSGMYDSFAGCGGTTTSVVNTVLSPGGRSEVIFVQVTMAGDADERVLERALATFKVGDIAGDGVG